MSRLLAHDSKLDQEVLKIYYFDLAPHVFAQLNLHKHVKIVQAVGDELCCADRFSQFKPELIGGPRNLLQVRYSH